MKWSKLKQRIEDTFADSIEGKIKIFNTSYRKAYDSTTLSRCWVEIKGKEVVNFCDYSSEIQFHALYHEDTTTECLTHRRINNDERGKDNLCEKGEFSSLDFKTMAFEYLNTNTHECLKSKHPLLRFLAVLNKKVGKNQLKRMIHDEHPLVSYFTQYRLQEELKI